MLRNIILFDIDAFFILGAKTLLHEVYNIHVTTSQDDVMKYVNEHENAIFVIDPSQFIGSLAEGFISSVRDGPKKTKVVFLIESKNRRNLYINRLLPHAVIEKNIKPELFVKLLELVNVGIYAGKE